eukprot:1578719-Amphidinium_carterae.1
MLATQHLPLKNTPDERLLVLILQLVLAGKLCSWHLVFFFPRCGQEFIKDSRGPPSEVTCLDAWCSYGPQCYSVPVSWCLPKMSLQGRFLAEAVESWTNGRDPFTDLENNVDDMDFHSSQCSDD